MTHTESSTGQEPPVHNENPATDTWIRREAAPATPTTPAAPGVDLPEPYDPKKDHVITDYNEAWGELLPALLALADLMSMAYKDEVTKRWMIEADYMQAANAISNVQSKAVELKEAADWMRDCYKMEKEDEAKHMRPHYAIKK